MGMAHTDASYSKSMWQPASDGQVQTEMHGGVNQGIYKNMAFTKTWHLHVLMQGMQSSNQPVMGVAHTKAYYNKSMWQWLGKPVMGKCKHSNALMEA